MSIIYIIFIKNLVANINMYILIILITHKNFYIYELMILFPQGITDQVTSLSTYLQCEESADWCNTQNKIVLAYSTESTTLSFYMSQDEGLTFIRKTLDYQNQV